MSEPDFILARAAIHRYIRTATPYEGDKDGAEVEVIYSSPSSIRAENLRMIVLGPLFGGLLGTACLLSSGLGPGAIIFYGLGIILLLLGVKSLSEKESLKSLPLLLLTENYLHYLPTDLKIPWRAVTQTYIRAAYLNSTETDRGVVVEHTQEDGATSSLLLPSKILDLTTEQLHEILSIYMIAAGQ